MTDRYIGFAVTLDADIRDDDACQIADALLMIKGVAVVEPITARPASDMLAASRENNRWLIAMRQATADTYQNKGNDRG